MDRVLSREGANKIMGGIICRRGAEGETATPFLFDA
jgi:hypothetical protein